MNTAVNKLLSGVLALGLMAGQAGATQVSGQQLLALCTANMHGKGNPLEAAECMGFVVGVADTFDCDEDHHGLRWNNRAPVSQPGIVKLVVDYIQAHPTALDSGAHVVVGKALSEAFPCGAKTAGN